MGAYSMIFGKPTSYVAVPHDFPQFSQQQQKIDCATDQGPEVRETSTRSRCRRSLLAVCLSLAFLSALALVVAHLPKGRPIQNNGTSFAETDDVDSDQPGQCGNSSAEALASGCTFDQLMWSWYPPNCPHYKNAEYLQAEDWKFYLDMEGREAAEGKMWHRAMDNEVPLWGEKREHLTHCVYLFLSLGQIIRDGTRFLAIMIEDEHLDHCAKKILDSLRKDDDWNSVDTAVPPVKYSVSC